MCSSHFNPYHTSSLNTQEHKVKHCFIKERPTCLSGADSSMVSLLISWSSCSLHWGNCSIPLIYLSSSPVIPKHTAQTLSLCIDIISHPLPRSSVCELFEGCKLCYSPLYFQRYHRGGSRVGAQKRMGSWMDRPKSWHIGVSKGMQLMIMLGQQCKVGLDTLRTGMYGHLGNPCNEYEKNCELSF